MKQEMLRDSVPIEIMESIVQGFIAQLQNMEKNNEIISAKLANMITISSFEGKMIELMLKKKYYDDNNSKKALDEIRENAKNFINVGIGRLNDTTNFKVFDDLESAQKENAELREAINKANQRIADLEKSYNDSRVAAENANKLGVEGINAYIELTTWYENMIAEMKNEEATKVKWYQTYKWQGGMACYIKQHPRPKVGTYIVKDLWGEWVMGQKK